MERRIKIIFLLMVPAIIVVGMVGIGGALLGIIPWNVELVVSLWSGIVFGAILVLAGTWGVVKDNFGIAKGLMLAVAGAGYVALALRMLQTHTIYPNLISTGLLLLWIGLLMPKKAKPA